MRRSFILAISLLIVAIIPSITADVPAKDKKGVILSTVDIDEEYEILGLVCYRSNELSPEKIHTELKKQAENMGADYVVGVTYFSNAGYLYGSGTAVKLIKNDKSKK